MTRSQERLYRCWCKKTWPVDFGKTCPECGKKTKFPAFTRVYRATGIFDDFDDGSEGAVRTIDLTNPNLESFEDIFVGTIDSPEWEAWCEEHGF